MKRLFPTMVLVLALLIPGLVEAQKSVTGGTGRVRFGLGRFGTFWIYDASGTPQIDRATILVALDSANVMDYTNDSQYLMTPTITTGGIADTMATALIDNTGLSVPTPPDVRVRETVYAWHNDLFAMVKYSVTNYSSGTYRVYLGVGVIPTVSGLYGGESVLYDPDKQMAYFFRYGDIPITGVALMGQAPYSFHVLDWHVYSPTDPNSDAATDSTRWAMTSRSGFDTGLMTAGPDGSFFNLNAGLRTIAPGDSTAFTVAYLSGTSVQGLKNLRDSADIRYAHTFTSVERVSPVVPKDFVLLQNYPNPFNPGTVIEFQLQHSSEVSLRVYDILGREVAVLANGSLNAGSYRVPFDAHQFASGIYYYRLIAGSFTDSKRMLLVK